MHKRQRNILNVLNGASQVEIDEGRVAYFNYRKVLLDLGSYYGYPLNQVVAVFAALSPNTDYYNNLRSAATVLNAHKEGLDRDKVKVSSYNHRRPYAFSYLDGVDFLGTVTGKKIRNFYQNILNPLDPYPVTIDGHALNIWRNERKRLQMSGIKPSLYEEIAEDYREVSRKVGLLPHQTQAITWLAWKWKNNLIPSKKQLHLFVDRSKDLWKTFYSPEDLPPYKPLE